MTSFKRLWNNKNYRTSAVIALALVAWLASGMLVTPQSKNVTEPEAAASSQAPEPLTEVRARHIRARAYPLTVSVTAQTEANRWVDLRAEVAGQVEAVPVEEGSYVEEGDVICRLAVDDRAQRLEEARAAAEQARIDYDGAQRMETGGFQSKTAIATAKARLEAARANLLRRDLDLKKTAIRTPFAGVVDERSAEIGQLIQVGDTCATLIDLDPLVVSAEVSEGDVVRIKQGGRATARLATGEKVEGVIRYISRRADENTRTFRVESAVANPDMRLMSGMTSNLSIDVGTVPAHLISASLLMLDEKGQLGVRVLDGDRRVAFYNVELVGDAGEGVWVTGLPESTLLITVGHHYVGVGEQVMVSLGDSDRPDNDHLDNNGAALGALQ